MTSSRNFAFLQSTHPHLADPLTLAEEHCFRDPGSAHVKMRIFGELLCMEVAQQRGVAIGGLDGLQQLAQALEEEGLIPRHVDHALRRIRVLGNAAAHQGSGTPESVIEALAKSHMIAKWFVTAFKIACTPAPGQFTPPDPMSDGAESLRVETETLRQQISRLLGERLAEAQKSERETEQAGRLTTTQRSAIAKLQLEIADLRRDLANREQLLESHARASSDHRAEAERASARMRELLGRVDQLEVELAQAKTRVAEVPHARPRATQPTQSTMKGPPCPKCGGTTAQREGKGRYLGRRFWCCERYPKCSGVMESRRDNGAPAQHASDSAATEPATPPSQIARHERERRAWRDTVRRPGWTVEYTTAGGRLRSFDPLLGFDERATGAASQVALFASASEGEVPEGMRLVANALRRVVTRGVRPPVDPQIEESLLQRTDLLRHTRPSRHPGDLARVPLTSAPRPDAGSIRAALCARAPFVLDGPLLSDAEDMLLDVGSDGALLLQWAPAALGPDAAQWFIPRVPLDLLVGAKDAILGRWVSFVVAPPEAAPFVIELESSRRAASPLDAQHDTMLNAAGYEVIRVSQSELHDGSGPSLGRIAGLWRKSTVRPSAETRLLLWGPAVAQRILLAISAAIDRGWVPGDRWVVRVDEPLGIGREAFRSAIEFADAISAVFSVDAVPSTVELRTREGVQLLERQRPGIFKAVEKLETLRDDPVRCDVEIVVDLDHGVMHALPASGDTRSIVIRSASLPVELADDRVFFSSSHRVPEVSVPSGAALERLLQGVFAKREFQPDGPAPRGQEIAIRRLLAGRDTVVLLPTGAGKSLIYQLTGLLLPGISLIVDPIVSLIDDQLEGLRQHGFDRAFGITSADTRHGTTEAKLQQVSAGDTMFVFVAPERLQHRAFREAVRELATGTPISIAVVDEAHCVSEWGHDFRTSYLDLGRVLRHVTADASGTAPPILALTGTASRAVLNDMLIELSVDRADPDLIVSPTSFDRAELRFSIVRAEPEELTATLVGALRTLPGRFADSSVPRTGDFFRPRGDDTACGVVFCPHVDGRRGVTRMAKALLPLVGRPVPIYAGSAPKEFGNGDFDVVKRENAAAFKRNDATILAATKAFGMGIDKPNVRFTVHVGIPGSIEAYYQEAGRAGRDRREAHCLILATPADREVHEYFRKRTFRGVPTDVEEVRLTLASIGDLDERRTVAIPMGTADEQRERAIHRLKLLGLVRDYLVDWRNRRFDVKLQPTTPQSIDDALLAFVRRSQPGRVPAMEMELARDGEMSIRAKLLRNAERMISFVYETIVAARVRAVDEMMLLAQSCTDDAQIRDRILRYLALSAVGDALEKLMGNDRFDFEDWQPLLDQMQSADEARDWRGATGRLLESEPEHPGLLLGRAFAETLVSTGDRRVFADNVRRALISANGKYAVTAAGMVTLADWLFARTRLVRAEWTPELYVSLSDAWRSDAEPFLERKELECLSHVGVDHLEELDVVLSRRIARHAGTLEQVAIHHLGVHP